MTSWTSYTSLSEDDFTAIHNHSGDPFSILGLHPQDNGMNSLRIYFPNAREITVITDEGYSTETMCLGDTGFFEAHLPAKVKRGDYRLEITMDSGDTFSILDPYSFDQVLTDFDIHLLASGTHYELYNVLGANPKVHQNTNGVVFSVWAPNARGVSVVGNFNSWDGRRHPLRKIGISGFWELFIPEIEKGEFYKFELFTEDGRMLPKLDPIAKLSEVRPSQCNVVWDNSQYFWSDSKWINRNGGKHNYQTPISVYELHLGSWKKPSDGREFKSYAELKKTLIPYIKESGYTHIELLPVLEHPLDESWGYQVTGYFAATSRYGNPDQLKDFINECHKEGIGVLLDWVPAHFPKDGLGLGRFDGSCLYEHMDHRQGEHPHWGTYIFNYGRKEVSNFLIASALFWLKEFHIDGLRVDAVASMLYLDYGKNDGEWVPNVDGGNINYEAIEFMKHLNSTIHQQCPHCIMIAEESTSFPNITIPPEKGGLGFHYKWNMGWMNDILSYFEKEPVHRKYHQNHLSFGLLYAFSERFMLVFSHDEVVHGKGSMIGKMPGDEWQKFANLRALYAFMYAHPGKKLHFMGCEIAQYREWNSKSQLDWHLLEHQPHKQVHSMLSSLNHLYKQEKALWLDDDSAASFQWLSCDDAQNSTLGFLRKTIAGETIMVLCNFTPVPRENYRFGVPIKGHFKEIFNSDSKYYGGSNLGNIEGLNTEEVPWDHYQNSVIALLPPLSVCYFKHEKTL